MSRQRMAFWTTPSGQEVLLNVVPAGTPIVDYATKQTTIVDDTTVVSSRGKAWASPVVVAAIEAARAGAQRPRP